MARKKKEVTPELVNGNVALPPELQPVPKDIKILGAKIKDDFCSYDFEYLTGVEKGIPQSAKKGIYIIDNDMKDAFAVFNVHLAVIDDLFKVAGIEVDDIDKFHDHEFTYLMECTEFKILGDTDNESIILIGTKHVSMNGRIKVETPKIPLDNLSSYMWYNELKTAADAARKEVELYKFGKYTIPEDQQEEEEEKKQTKILFGTGTEDVPGSEEISDVEFEDEFGEARI